MLDPAAVVVPAAEVVPAAVLDSAAVLSTGPAALGLGGSPRRPKPPAVLDRGCLTHVGTGRLTGREQNLR